MNTISPPPTLNQHLRDFGFIALGILSFTFGLNALLIPNHFLDGGVTGIALFIHEKLHWNIAALLIVANIPFVIFGARLIGRDFAIRTSVALVALAASLTFLKFGDMHVDNDILVAIFGGLFLGLGIGLGMHGGAALDGIEILAAFTWRKIGFSLSEILLGLNAVIFLFAGFFISWETAFLSMLTYFVATKTIDYVIEGIDEYTGITIISAGMSETIKEFLVEQMGKGITVYKGERGFMKGHIQESTACDIIFTVVNRLEVRSIKDKINAIDSRAFIFASSVKETAGGILKLRRAKH
jgi:uncharacterized membrane-anchored protein YitT (DUF2179 family)